MRWFLEPGLWQNPAVRVALVVGALVAVVSSAVGLFTVVRGQSFAGHALTDIATAGGTGAFLGGLSPLTGFLGGGVLGAGALEAVGVERVRDADVATGVVLGAATGLSALFLYLATLRGSASGGTQSILFGSVFTVATSTVPDVLVVALVVLVTLVAIRRPLLLASLSPELARARGVRVRLVGTVFLLIVALAVGLAAIVVGSILSTALLIGPPASALKFGTSLRRSVPIAIGLGVLATTLGVVLAYDSFYWSASGRSLPVSFFIVVLVVLEFAVALVVERRRLRHVAPTALAHATSETKGWL